jgi:hypothetical protein
MAEFINNCANTVIPAYLVLQSKGYQVWSERGTVATEDETWFAKGALATFRAGDPVTLLGLVALREARGAEWRASDEQVDSFIKLFNLGNI